MLTPLPEGVCGHASFELADGARVGRLRLDRWWHLDLDVDFGRPSDDRYRPLVVIGTNPSEACGEQDDNTVRKLYGFARRLGANGIVVVNTHPAITPKPAEVARILLPYGADERHWDAVAVALSEAAVAHVAAWGKPPRGLTSHHDRVARVKAIAADVGVTLMCWGKNGDGSPKHPLYLPYETPLELYEAA